MKSIHDRLMLKVEPDLSKISFHLLGGDKAKLLGVIEKPLLLWDTEMVRGLDIGPQIGALFGEETLIEYDNVLITWSKEVWPPSIDSLFFAKVLRKAGYTAKPISSIYDVGCGTGFLGIFLAKHNHFVKTVYAIDVDDKAMALTLRNAMANGINHKLVAKRGDFTQEKTSLMVDLIVSAPPYIPTLSDAKVHPFYAGTHLLEFLVTRGGEMCKEMLLTYSDLADQVIGDKKSDSEVSREVLDNMEVPFRVGTVLRDPEWISFLVDNRGLIEKPPDTNFGYRYWHTIKVERISFRTDGI